MEVWAVSIMVLLTVAVVWGFCFFVARRYIDVREKNALTIFAATVALSLTLLTMLLVPVDIYIVSSDLTSDGLQTNPDLVNNSAEGIKYIYYVMYILLIIFAFGIMPFAYFWFEEDGEDITPRKRAFEAGKYTAGFIIIFVVLLTLGIVLKKNINSKNQENQWQNTLSNTFDETDSIISFCICTLAIFGLAGWIFYTAYGLASIPIVLLRRAGPVPTKKEANLEMKRRRVEEEMKFLSSKYGQNDKWTKKDENEYNRLKRENERLNQIQDTTPVPKEDFFSRVWNSFAPVRIVLSLALLGVSLLIVISILLSTIDRFQHSDCGYSCGYALTSASMWNPIDMAMVTFEKVFPIDYLFFGALICYLLICTINGLSNLGVRCLCWQLYEVRKGMTPPNGLLFGFWLVMMNMLALNLQLTTLAPQYSVYGRQFYYDWAINSSADNTTNNFVAPSLIDTTTTTAIATPTTTTNNANAVLNALRQRSNLFANTLDPILVAETNFTQNYTADDCPGVPGCYRTSDKMECTVKVDNRTGQCVSTQIGVFINTVNVQLPFFGTILLCGNVFFLAAYFIFALVVLCRGSRPPPGYKKLGGKDDLWNGET